MKAWDYIFPKEKHIIIWGAGDEGRKWLFFLLKLGRKIDYIFDNNFSGSICNLPVVKPKVTDNESVVLLISPVKYTDEILREAKKLNFEDIRIGKLLKFIPRYENFGEDLDDYTFPSFGHYYSLYPDLNEVDSFYEQAAEISESGLDKDGIDLNDEVQLQLLSKMNEMYSSLPAWEEYGNETSSNYRYRIFNPSFCVYDASILHFMIRIFQPKRYIEVGSGWTSGVVLDTVEYYLEEKINFKLIEPYPKRLYSLLKKNDRNIIDCHEEKLQDIPLDFFDMLDKNDILFIDSTHVIKFNSDVNYLFFHILPRLRRGVIVHLHDIFYPWQYPKEWIRKGMGWNEMFVLRAFLQYNPEWEILYYANYMEHKYLEYYCAEWRQQDSFCGGSFWMRKR